MAVPRLGGPGIGLGLGGQISNYLSMRAGQTFMIPAGTYAVIPGPWTSIQFFDPVSLRWLNASADVGFQGMFVESDGGNFRLACLCGTPVGAIITNAGTGYANGIGTTATGVTINISTGTSKWTPIVGGAINSTLTITAGGANYQYIPQLVVSAPPPGGLPAIAHVNTLTAGAITQVIVDSQGAGYKSAPTINVVNDTRDTLGGGGVITVNPTLVGSGSLLAMTPNDPGGPLAGGTGSVNPTFTFAPASTTAASSVMNWAVQSMIVTGGGVAVPAGSWLTCQPLVNTATAAANTDGYYYGNFLTMPRPCMAVPVITGGVIQANPYMVDNGFGFQVSPVAVCLINSTGVAPTTGINIGASVGSINDVSYLQPI